MKRYNIKDVYFNLKDASLEQKKAIKSILLRHYTNLLDDMEKYGDYGYIDKYWTDFEPQSKPILSAKEFIKKFK